jgi:tetratricopeptide (TPR) repeat protein
MYNSGYLEPAPLPDGSAISYDCSTGKPMPSRTMDYSSAFSAYGIYSTAEDLQKWNEALYTEKLLSKEWLDIYFRPNKSVWACDWMILTDPFHNANENSLMTLRGGSASRYICFDIRLVNKKGSIILMCNTASSRMEEITKNLIGLFYGRPAQTPKQSLHHSFVASAENMGMAAAADETLTKAKDTAHYYTSASEFLHLGYWYRYEKKDLTSAIRVFELMTKLFPDTYNVYDSDLFTDTSNVYGILGSAYVEDGQKEKAIASFKKALKLDPRDKTAAGWLKKLTTTSPTY